MDKNQEECAFTAKEREWVHTASKFVETKHLPMAGRLLQMFEDTSTLVGRWVLLALMFGGMTGVLGYIGFKIFKWKVLP